MAKKQSLPYESYVASAKSAAKVLGAPAAVSAYKIEVRFLGGLTAAQKNAFKTAADRWTKVIVGDLPSVQVDGEVIDDLLILAQGVAIDGPGGILGQAGPTHLRPAGAGTSAFLPVKGIMSFDTADLAQMQADGTLKDVITHEMGHVIGIGTIWYALTTSGGMIGLISSEWLRMRSRRLVKVLAVLALLGIVVAVVIGAIQSQRPSAGALALAERQAERVFDDCVAQDGFGAVEPGGDVDAFCREQADPSFFLAEQPLRLSELPDILRGTAFVAILIGLVIGASAVGASWQTGTMTTILTWEPRRAKG